MNEECTVKLGAISNWFEENSGAHFQNQTEYYAYLKDYGFSEVKGGVQIQLKNGQGKYYLYIPVCFTNDNPFGLCLVSRDSFQGGTQRVVVPIPSSLMTDFIPTRGKSTDHVISFLYKNQVHRNTAWQLALKVIKPLLIFTSNPCRETLKELKPAVAHLSSFYNEDELTARGKILESWSNPTIMPYLLGISVSDFLKIFKFISEVNSKRITSYSLPDECNLHSSILKSMLSKSKMFSEEKVSISKLKNFLVKYIEKVREEKILENEYGTFPIAVGNSDFKQCTIIPSASIYFSDQGFYHSNINLMAFQFLTKYLPTKDYFSFVNIFTEEMDSCVSYELRNKGYSEEVLDVLEEYCQLGLSLSKKSKEPLDKETLHTLLAVQNFPDNSLTIERWDG